MKKTLLATAIAGAMVYGATSAQAATVYDQDGTQLDVYGRIALGIRAGGPEYNAAGDEKIDNGPEFVDVYSRLGLRGNQQISSDLNAFAHVEWRFRGDEAGNRNGNNFDAFSETRQSYIGLRSNSWGTVQAGNFDSFYKNAVSAPFDVYLDRGLEFKGHPTQSRGDSLGYVTPDLSGFQVHLQGKHYSDRGAPESADTDDTIAAQGGLVYEIAGLRLAAGFVDDVIEGDGGNDEMVYGTTASYAINDAFSARLGYETRDDNDDPAIGGGYDTWGVGMSYSMGQWAFNADLYDVSPDEGDSRTAWALGTYYTISSNFNVFAEVQQADQPSITVGGDGDFVETADGDDPYFLTGARYHF